VKFKVVIYDEFIYDLEEVIEYYNLRSFEIEKKLVKEFEDLVALITVNPYLFRKRRKEYRLARFKKFPFLIVFEVKKDQIFVSKLIHTKRNPKKRFT